MALTRKTLEDLWRSGKEYDISPDGDGTAMIFVRKLGPTQQAAAVKMANAERAKVTLISKNPEDPRYQAMLEEISEVSREQRIEQLAMAEIASDRDKVEQELSEKEEWGDDKLQSLVDSWEGGLLQEWLKGEGNRSEESERVWAEINRFSDEVKTRLEGKLERAKAELEHLSDEALEKKVINAQLDYDASLAWLRVFRMNQIAFSVHNEDREKLFASVEEVETLPADLFAKIVDAITDLNNTPLDVKS